MTISPIDLIIDDLTKNRDEYKRKIRTLVYVRNQMLIENKIDYQDLIDGYVIAVIEMLIPVMVERFPQIYIDDLIGTLQELDLLAFFEPIN